MNKLISGGLIALIICFYFWTALSNAGYPKAASNHFYPQLAESFIQGRFFLDVAPKPELLALKNPYDPKSNEKWRLHDASLYQGKYYLYFGPTPVIILFVPFRLLIGVYLYQPFAVVFFCCVGLGFAVALLDRIIREHFSALPHTFRLLAILALGFSSAIPHLLRRPDVYEVAISCAYSLLFAGYYFFYRGLSSSTYAGRWFIASATAFALAVGARLNYVCIAPFFIAVVASWLWKVRRSHGDFGKTMFGVMAPFIIIGTALACYNFMRFGNVFENGQSYQLAAFDLKRHAFLQIQHLPYNLYYYFLYIPKLYLHFPYFVADVAFATWKPYPEFGLEKIGGIFVMAPITILSLGFPLLLKKQRSLAFMVLMMVGCVIGILMPVLMAAGATMRYCVDFMPSLLFVGLLVSFQYVGNETGARISVIPRYLLVTTLVMGCVIGFLLSMTGYYNPMVEHNPETYRAIAGLFEPFDKLIYCLRHSFRP